MASILVLGAGSVAPLPAGTLTFKYEQTDGSFVEFQIPVPEIPTGEWFDDLIPQQDGSYIGWSWDNVYTTLWQSSLYRPDKVFGSDAASTAAAVCDASKSSYTSAGSFGDHFQAGSAESPLVPRHQIVGPGLMGARGLHGILEVGPRQHERVPQPLFIHGNDPQEVEEVAQGPPRLLRGVSPELTGVLDPSVPVV